MKYILIFSLLFTVCQAQTITYCKNDPKLIAYQDSLKKYEDYQNECICHRGAMEKVYPPKRVVIYKEAPKINPVIKQPPVEIAEVIPPKKEMKVVYREQEKKITTTWKTKSTNGEIRVDSSLTVIKQVKSP